MDNGFHRCSPPVVPALRQQAAHLLLRQQPAHLSLQTAKSGLALPLAAIQPVAVHAWDRALSQNSRLMAVQGRTQHLRLPKSPKATCYVPVEPVSTDVPLTPAPTARCTRRQWQPAFAWLTGTFGQAP